MEIPVSLTSGQTNTSILESNDGSVKKRISSSQEENDEESRLLASFPEPNGNLSVSAEIPNESDQQSYFSKLKPLFEIVYNAILFSIPWFQKLHKLLNDLWKLLQPYHPDEFAPVLFGLVMCFFGGHFFTIFAAIEAYKLCGWENTRKCFKVIYDDFQGVLKASKLEDKND